MYDDEDIADLADSGKLSQAVGILPPVVWAEVSLHFDPALVNTDINLLPLVERIKFVGACQGLNVLFYGPPGTGKTEFAQHIAKTLGLKSMVVRTSDVLFSRVGVSEKIIRQIFAHAKRNQASIIIDEADSLLYDRKQTERLWQAQLVNEFIQEIDKHNFPIFCTTNSLEDLDSAVLRRFMFKVAFLPLNKEQRARAFQKYFGAACPDYVENLDNLTLADFGLVYKKAKLLGYLHDLPNLLKLFYDELTARFTYQQKAPKKRKSG
ncbi:MAG: AAA family ATPase [Alphaproteobacteria bacterium]|nr:AAA family ATPase [Alphaproteobacteria bacterium]